LELPATLSRLDELFPTAEVGDEAKRVIVLMLTTPLDESLERAVADLDSE